MPYRFYDKIHKKTKHLKKNQTIHINVQIFRLFMYLSFIFYIKLGFYVKLVSLVPIACPVDFI